MKTEASRNGLPMLPELAATPEWRKHTPYPACDHSVVASLFTNGKRHDWPDAALRHQIGPAVEAAGIKKRVSWHTLRRSLATFAKHQRRKPKTIQEILRQAFFLCSYLSPSKHSLSYLFCMAGTTGLEPATSAVTE